MRNRGVLVRLILLVVIPVLAFCGLGIYGMWNAWSTFESVEQVHGTAVDFRESTLNLVEPLNQLRQVSLTMVMAPNRDLREKLARDQTDLTREIDIAFDNWSLDTSSDDAADAFNELKASWGNYKKLKDVTVTKVLSDYREEAFINAFDAEARQFQLVKDSLATWMKAKITKADSVYKAADESYSAASLISTVLVITLAIVMGGFGSFTMSRIIGPIQTIRNAATRIASNTSTSSLASALDERIDVQSKDELGELARAFNQMVENLRAATERLSVEEKRIQAILNSTADGIITVDDSGIVQSFNESAERLLSYRADEAIGSTVTKMIPVLQQQGQGSQVERNFRSSAAALLNGERQVDAITRSGQAIPTSLRVREMNYLGERLLIATMQDIRVRKQTPEERSQFAWILISPEPGHSVLHQFPACRSASRNLRALSNSPKLAACTANLSSSGVTVVSTGSPNLVPVSVE